MPKSKIQFINQRSWFGGACVSGIGDSSCGDCVNNDNTVSVWFIDAYVHALRPRNVNVPNYGFIKYADIKA